MLSLVFAVFSVPSVMKAISVGEEKAFNTTEDAENTEKSSHGSPFGRRGDLRASESREVMGRTVPTFRQLVDDAMAHWAKFRRALRREDQEYFDRLFRRVRSHTQAATYQASDNPMEAILLSIALDQEKRLDALERAAPRQVGAALPPIAGAGSTLALNASGEAWSPPETGAGSTWSPPEKSPEQLDAPGSPDENEQLDMQPGTNQQLNIHQRMPLRSLPEPAGDDTVADRAESDAPPAD